MNTIYHLYSIFDRAPTAHAPDTLFIIVYTAVSKCHYSRGIKKKTHKQEQLFLEELYLDFLLYYIIELL